MTRDLRAVGRAALNAWLRLVETYELSRAAAQRVTSAGNPLGALLRVLREMGLRV